MFSWGEESGGRLGHGVCSSFPYPNLIHEFDGSSVELADCGEFNTCAVIASGELYAWGDGAHNAGLLGIGSETSHWKPVRILGQMEGINVRTISCGACIQLLCHQKVSCLHMVTVLLVRLDMVIVSCPDPR